jgi:hypothetical protein
MARRNTTRPAPAVDRSDLTAVRLAIVARRAERAAVASAPVDLATAIARGRAWVEANAARVDVAALATPAGGKPSFAPGSIAVAGFVGTDVVVAHIEAAIVAHYAALPAGTVTLSDADRTTRLRAIETELVDLDTTEAAIVADLRADGGPVPAWPGEGDR